MLINTIIILSPNSYLTTNYIDEQQEQRIHRSSSRELTSNFLIVFLKLLKVFADVIFLGSFAHILVQGSAENVDHMLLYYIQEC